MSEMMNYIFENMRQTEKKMNRVARTLNAQKRSNRATLRVVCGLTIALFIQSREVKNMSLRIKKLENEIAEIKESEEE